MRTVFLGLLAFALAWTTGCGGSFDKPFSGDDDDDLGVVPQNVSFSADVYGIFDARGCTECHAGGGPGKDDGGLMLNAGINPTWREVVEEESPNHGIARVDVNDPMASLILLMTATDSPPAPHPVREFTSGQDPDFLTLVGWIQEGAQNN